MTIDHESELACCTDLVNSWCRESGVRQCHDPEQPLALRYAIDRLWSKWSGEVDSLRRRLDEQSTERVTVVSADLVEGTVTVSMPNAWGGVVQAGTVLIGTQIDPPAKEVPA